MNWLLQCIKWIYELIAAMHEMNLWIDYCKVWNEWMNWWLQYIRWMDELMTAMYGMNWWLQCMELMDE